MSFASPVLQVTTAETRAKNSLMVNVTQKLRRSGIPGHIVVGLMKAVIKIYSLGAGWHTRLSTLERRELITRRDSERELLHSAPRKLPEFAEITQNNGHYAVQGHSRSPILIPIKRSYTTSYQ